MPLTLLEDYVPVSTDASDCVVALEALVGIMSSKALGTYWVLVFESEPLTRQRYSALEAHETFPMIRLQPVRHTTSFDRLRALGALDGE
jgi:hypothetical protein